MYPPALSLLPAFPAWLHNHVRELRRDGFPLSEDLVRLSSPPSEFADSYRYMHAYGALYRCQVGESSTNHVTFDSGIARRLSEQQTSGIDVGVLRELLMVEYGALKPVVMKVSWIKHREEGRRTIKRDPHGFWMARIDSMDLVYHENPFVFPEHVSQVFFMDDARDERWKVVLSHEPRSKREVGEYDHTMFAGVGHAPGTAGLFPTGVDTSEGATGTQDLHQPTAEVPLPTIAVLDALQLPPEDDAFYEDDQYQDDYTVYEGP